MSCQCFNQRFSYPASLPTTAVTVLISLPSKCCQMELITFVWRESKCPEWTRSLKCTERRSAHLLILWMHQCRPARAFGGFAGTLTNTSVNTEAKHFFCAFVRLSAKNITSDEDQDARYVYISKACVDSTGLAALFKSIRSLCIFFTCTHVAYSI